jgi:hypothetical protein
MFVGAFGLLDEETAVADLCGVAEALVGEEKDEGKSGHELLIRIANAKGLGHISRYIRTKLTDDQARMVYVHLGLHPEKIQEFVEAIPPPEKVEKLQTVSTSLGTSVGTVRGLAGGVILAPFTGGSSLAVGGACTGVGGFGGFCLGKSAGETIADNEVNKSEALQLSLRICKEWLQDFGNLEPRRVGKVVTLLQKLQKKDQSKRTTSNSSDSQKPELNTMLDKLGKHVYGRTPMQKSLMQSLEVFKHNKNAENRVLVLLSDGVSTDGDPLPTTHELRKENVLVATVYLTSDPAVTFQRHLHHKALSSWNDGQRVLFNMAHRTSCLKHPIPVLATLGWKIPSDGEATLHATVNSAAALDSSALCC